MQGQGRVPQQEDKDLGNIVEILPRFNSLIRPAVANVDQTIIIFAVSEPEPNFNLLDRFLVSMEKSDVKTIICFNKTDLSPDNMETCRSYSKSGYETLFISARENEGIEELRELLRDRTTVFAGPSGVGKSSTLNAIKPEAEAQTGAVSEKIKRGKHTTRHSELMHIEGDTYIMDTPGFSSLYVDSIEPEDLKEYFPDIAVYTGKCRFNMCNHISEPPPCQVPLSHPRYEQNPLTIMKVIELSLYPFYHFLFSFKSLYIMT